LIISPHRLFRKCCNALDLSFCLFRCVCVCHI